MTINLPPIEDVMRRAQALAVLDLIMSTDSGFRYHSFTRHWSENERMASMRNFSVRSTSGVLGYGRETA